MKKIDNGIYTTAHNIIFVDKDYDFLSLFLKGNKTILNRAENINKVHVCVGFTRNTFKLFEMLDNIAANSKSKIIFHVCSNTINRNFKVYLKNNGYSCNMNFNMHEDKKPFSFNDDAGELVVFPYSTVTDRNTNNKTIKRQMNNVVNKRRENKGGCKK